MYELEQTLALLARGPATFDALLRGLPDEWTLKHEGDGTWNAVEVVGHLVHGEQTNWMPRARMILEHGEERIFEPFDRSPVEGWPLERLLDEFARLRALNLLELRALNLGAEEMEKTGMHPAFGRVTLGQLLATWAVHDMTHLNQLSRVLAYQYRDAVGPWSEYLGVLRRSGS